MKIISKQLVSFWAGDVFKEMVLNELGFSVNFKITLRFLFRHLFQTLFAFLLTTVK